MALSDRRRQPRIPVERPAKILIDGSGRYCPAVVINVSSSGALIRLLSRNAVPADAVVHLGLPGERDQTVIERSEMMTARVVRTLGYDDAAHLGIRFEVEQPAVVEEARATLRVA